MCCGTVSSETAELAACCLHQGLKKACWKEESLSSPRLSQYPLQENASETVLPAVSAHTIRHGHPATLQRARRKRLVSSACFCSLARRRQAASPQVSHADPFPPNAHHALGEASTGGQTTDVRIRKALPKARLLSIDAAVEVSVGSETLGCAGPNSHEIVDIAQIVQSELIGASRQPQCVQDRLVRVRVEDDSGRSCCAGSRKVRGLRRFWHGGRELAASCSRSIKRRQPRWQAAGSLGPFVCSTPQSQSKTHGCHAQLN